MAVICDTSGVYALYDTSRLEIGLADASIVAAAERLNVARLLTQDHRHFRAITPRHITHFILLPADAS